MNEMVCDPRQINGEWTGCGCCARCERYGVDLYRIDLPPLPNTSKNHRPLTTAERKTISE